MLQMQAPALHIRGESLQEEIVNALRQAIVKGELKPGQRLMEAELAEEFGVSRAPLREALAQLIADGLLVSLPRKGTYVLKLTEQDIREIYSLRLALETVAVEILVECITPQQIEELEHIIAQMEEAEARNDLWMAVELDVKLHKAMCQMSGHSRLYQAWSRITDQLRAFFAAADRQLSDRHMIIDRHQSLISAVTSGNREEALAALKEHMSYSVDLVLNSPEFTDGRAKEGSI